MFSFCSVSVFDLSYNSNFPAYTDVNGTVLPNCADVLLRNCSLTPRLIRHNFIFLIIIVCFSCNQFASCVHVLCHLIIAQTLILLAVDCCFITYVYIVH